MPHVNKTRYLLAFALLHCARVTQKPPPPVAELVRVPDGCLADLSGEWVHAFDSSYRYFATDDGGTLTLVAYRGWPTDAGTAQNALDGGDGAPAAVVTLHRSSEGFAGEAVATIQHPTGKSCAVRFVTRAVSCADGGLSLQSAASVAVSDTCETPQKPRAEPLLEHRLARPDAGGGVLR